MGCSTSRTKAAYTWEEISKWAHPVVEEIIWDYTSAMRSVALAWKKRNIRLFSSAQMLLTTSEKILFSRYVKWHDFPIGWDTMFPPVEWSRSDSPVRGGC